MWRPLKSATKIGKYRGRRGFIAALRTDYFFRAKSWIFSLPAEAQQQLRLTNGATVSAAQHKPLLPGQPGHEPNHADHIHRPQRRSRLAHAHRSAGVCVCVQQAASASMHVQLHAQPRVKHARLKMRGQGWRSARHVHVSVRLCATRGTGERTIGGDKDSIGDGRMWFRTWFVCKL